MTGGSPAQILDRAAQAWIKGNFAEFEHDWRNGAGALLSACRAVVENLDIQARDKFQPLLEQSDRQRQQSAEAIVQGWNSSLELKADEIAQLANWTSAVAHTLAAAFSFQQHRTDEKFDEFFTYGVEAVRYMSRLWSIDRREFSLADPVWITQPDDWRSPLCRLQQSAAFASKQNQFNVSGWLGFERLFCDLLGRQGDRIRRLTAPILLYSGRGHVYQLEVELAESLTTGGYVDPIALGGVVLDEVMLESLRGALVICDQKLRQLAGKHGELALRVAIRHSESKFKPSYIDGGSAGLMFACGMYALVDGKRLNRRMSATAALAIEAAAAGEPLWGWRLKSGKVRDESIKPKLRAAAEAEITKVVMAPEQAAGYQKSAKQFGVELIPAETFRDVYQRLTSDEHYEAILAQYCAATVEEWNGWANSPDHEHRIDHYVDPRFSLLKKGCTPYDSSRREQSGKPDSADADQNYRPIEAAGVEALAQLLESGQRLCVTEDAGFGKSVFAWKSQQYLSSSDGRRRFFKGDPPLVVRWEGRWPTGKKTGRPQTLKSALRRELCRRLPNLSIKEVAQTIDYALEAGRVVLILDALDQFSEKRLKHLRKLLAPGQEDSLPDNCRVIVTSRAYKMNEEEAVFKKAAWRYARIDGFTEEKQQDQYLQDLDPLWKELVPNREDVAELLRSPMVLRLIRDILEDFQTQGGPQGELKPFRFRGDLYWEASRRLLKRALDKKGIAASDELLHDLRRVVSTIALEMMLDSDHRFVSADSAYAISGAKIQPLLRSARDRYLRDVEDFEKAKQAQVWKQCVSILNQIDFTNRSTLEAFNKESLSFRSLKTMEFYAGLYLAAFVTGPCADEAKRFNNDPRWHWAWRFAIEMPEEARYDEALLLSLAQLFEPPPEGSPPTELMFRAWGFFETEAHEEIRREWPQQQPLPGAAAVLRRWRWRLWEKFARCSPAQQDEVLRLFPDDRVLALLDAPANEAEAAAQRNGFDFERQQVEQLRQWLRPHRDKLQKRNDSFTDRSYHPCPPEAPDFWMQSFTVTDGPFCLFDALDDLGNQRDAESDRPAVYMRLYSAWMFSKWLGAGYRLPVEKEWEFACRAGSQQDYWWGEKFDEKHCNADDGIGRTLGRRESQEQRTHGFEYQNPYGLYHASGNVDEWCLSRDNRAGSAFVVRGGSFFDFPRFCGSSFRYHFRRRFYLGFRVLCCFPASPSSS